MDNIYFLARVDHMKKPLTVSVSHPSVKVGIEALIFCFLFKKCARSESGQQIGHRNSERSYLKYAFS